MAPGAKLAFDELPTLVTADGEFLFAADDLKFLNAQLPPPCLFCRGESIFHEQGEQLPLLRLYDTMDLELDTFLQDHPDHVMSSSSRRQEMPDPTIFPLGRRLRPRTPCLSVPLGSRSLA
jgi:hypothetical protein